MEKIYGIEQTLAHEDSNEPDIIAFFTNEDAAQEVCATLIAEDEGGSVKYSVIEVEPYKTADEFFADYEKEEEENSANN